MNTQTQPAADEDFSELDALLNTSMDDVANLPEYIDEIPSGSYKLKITKCERKKVEITDKTTKAKTLATVIELNFQTLECKELTDESKRDKVPAMGGIISESIFFNKDPEQAKSVIKAKFEEVAKAQGFGDLLTLINNLTGMDVFATVKCKPNTKAGKEGTYFIQVTNCVPA